MDNKLTDDQVLSITENLFSEYTDFSDFCDKLEILHVAHNFNIQQQGLIAERYAKEMADKYRRSIMNFFDMIRKGYKGH